MFNILEKKLQKNAGRLDFILKPVENELVQLNKTMLTSLESGNKDLDKMVFYVFKSGGKRLRPAIVLLFAKALSGCVFQQQFEIAEAIEMIHTATLLHDDVIDDAETRRGMPAAHKKWGAKSAIIAGDYILSRALNKLVSIGLLAVEMFTGTLNELCVGEILQKNQKYSLISLEDYINKSERKTAKLFMAGVECVASTVPDSNNLIIRAAREYSRNYGIAFQITDDIINFTRCSGCDLRDGIITAPVIYAAEEIPELKKLINRDLSNEKHFKKVLKLVLSSGGIEKARLLAQEYALSAVSAIEALEDNSYKRALVDLANYTAERNL